MFVEPTSTSHEALYGAVSVIALQIARWIADNHKGRKRDQRATASDGRIEQKIDASIREQRGFVDEQRKTNDRFDRRISGAYYLLTGADDEHGENGVRGNSRDHENRIRDLERHLGSISPSEVGSFQRRA